MMPLRRDSIRFEQPSGEQAQRQLHELQDTLAAIHCDAFPQHDFVAWPSGLDKRLVYSLPFATRTRNCLLKASPFIEHSAFNHDVVTVGQLLGLPAFGDQSLTDLVLTIERYLIECAQGKEEEFLLAGESVEDLSEVPEVVHTPTTDSQTMRGDGAKQVLARLFASAEELLDVRTFADVLSPEVMTLANRMGLDSEVGEIGIDHLAGSASGLLSNMVIRVRVVIDSLTETDHMVIDHRLINNPPVTLEQVGTQLGVTRERIRQIQEKIEKKVQIALGVDLAIVASVLKERLGQVIDEGELERRMDELLSVGQGRATKLLRRALLDEMGFELDAGVFLDKRAKEELESIRGEARRLADDVGLIDKHRFIESLPFERWRQRWPWVRKHCKLVELFGSLGIRDTGKARVKAALISIGRPATRDEIARMCGYKDTKAGSHLSVIPSIVKADKDRWALREWVDEEYRGIAEKIIQRIEEDGGATTTEKLLTEIPDKFGVHKSSVRAYMETPKFVINDGWVSLANKSSVRLRDLDDVIDGRDHTGAPYWSFPVEARYFDGYSVSSVPPELAKELGCGPDGSERVLLENLPDCRDLSINWPLASTTGASLGYVGEPLKRLGLEPGRRARLTIKGYCLVQLTADDESQESADVDANMVVERMMKRRKVL